MAQLHTHILNKGKKIMAQLHTRQEVCEQIKILEQSLYRTKQNPRAYDIVCMLERHIEDLKEVLEETNWDERLVDLGE